MERILFFQWIDILSWKNGLCGSKEMMGSISVLAYTVQQVKKVKYQKNMLNFLKTIYNIHKYTYTYIFMV